jgi:hypothetical protein
VLAGFLLVAQLFVQLHAVGHLDDEAHNGQGEGPCLVCLLSADMEAGDIPSVASSDRHHAPTEQTAPTYLIVLGHSFRAFAVRAPPPISSVA